MRPRGLVTFVAVLLCSAVVPPVTVGRAKTVYNEADIQTGVLSEPLRFADHEQVGVTATFSELFGKPLLGHGRAVLSSRRS